MQNVNSTSLQIILAEYQIFLSFHFNDTFSTVKSLLDQPEIFSYDITLFR